MSTSKSSFNVCPVPLEQQPLTEYERLKERPGFSWTTEPEKRYFQALFSIALFCLGLCFTLGRASTPSSGGDQEPIVYLYSVTGALTLLMLIYIRIYLGWQYVYNRLMRSTVPYEESGWYDGQTWVKSPEALVQDRLTGTYQLRPILERLKVTLGALIVLQIGIISYIANS